MKFSDEQISQYTTIFKIQFTFHSEDIPNISNLLNYSQGGQ